MVWVALSIGSNTHARENFHSCLDMLLLQFRDLALSSVYESEGDGVPGRRYLNMAAGFETDMPMPEIVALLKQIEDKHGRARAPAAGDEVTLDIDLLIYGERSGNFGGAQLPHPDILRKSYVLRPLSQIGGKHRHPVLKKKYNELLSELSSQFEQAGQRLQPVAFAWHGRELSRH